MGEKGEIGENGEKGENGKKGVSIDCQTESGRNHRDIEEITLTRFIAQARIHPRNNNCMGG